MQNLQRRVNSLLLVETVKRQELKKEMTPKARKVKKEKVKEKVKEKMLLKKQVKKKR